MQSIEVGAAFIAFVSFVVYVKILQSRAKKVGGGIFLIGHFLRGKPWHGHAITDAGWSRKGTKVFTETGHASWFWHQTERRRVALRVAIVSMILSIVAGLVFDRTRTEIEIIVLAVLGLSIGPLMARESRKNRGHHSEWVVPLHLSAAEVAGWPIAKPAREWLTVTPDRDFAQLKLPVNFRGEEVQLKRLDQIVSARLALEAPIRTARLGGMAPALTYTASKPPPSIVPVAGLMPDIRAAKEDVAVLGRGKRNQIVAINFGQDSPHVGVSMPPDTGKTSIARLILPQQLRKGWLALILDYKLMSHMWAYGCPNVWYAAEIEEIHAAAIWVSEEFDRRKKEALAIGRREGGRSGRVYHEVGKRILVCYEEANATSRQLRDLWHVIRTAGQPKYSPAVRGLELGHFSARELGINFMTFAQMLSAKAALSPEARETMGTRIVGSYSTLNNWRIMAPEHPMPRMTRHKGRVQVVAGGVPTETQVGWIEDDEAHELALSGTVARWSEIAATATAPIGNGASGPAVVTVAPEPINPSRRLVGLAEAAQKKVIPVSLSAAKMHRHRDKDNFPAYRDQRGTELLYDAAELRAYYREREQNRGRT